MDDDDEPLHFLERGHKSDSYIFAVTNNRIPLELDPPPKADIACGTHLFIVRKTGQLTWEDVELYRYDPFWRRLRRSLFVAFWLTWILLFLGAICLVVGGPKCDGVDVGKWWTSALIYEIWTTSFADSNEDGVGDLNGLRVHLADLRSIGIDAIFLRQLLRADASGMGVMNFVKVDERLGNLSDVRTLINASHAAGLKVIIDFPLVVTSSAHAWFQRSARAHLPENAKFSAFYYWKRGVAVSPYVSELQDGGNASISYFHMRDRPDLPILNWNSALVSQAIKRALSFWIDHDVDGIHFSSVDYLHRSFDGFQPEWDVIIKFLRGIRDHIQHYANTTRQSNGGGEMFVMASPGDLDEKQKRRLAAESGFTGVMNTEPTRIALRNRICYRNEVTVASCVNEILADLLRFYATSLNATTTREPKVSPVWNFSNSFTSRLASRLHSRRHAELLTMIELCLPGTPVVLYGEELGLSDCCYDAEPLYRGRGKMPWDSTSNSYVINNNVSLKPINFLAEMSDVHSQLSTFRRLVRLRRHYKALGPRGAVQIGARVGNAFAFCRYISTDGRSFDNVMVLAVNFGNDPIYLPLTDLPPFVAATHWTAQIVAVSSCGDDDRPHHYLYERLDLSDGRLLISAEEGVLLKLFS